MIAKNILVSSLLDCYGSVLTEKQREVLDYYYNEDLSLSEIAENEKITRQAVRDTIKRAEAQLNDLEQKLGFFQMQIKIAKHADEIFSIAEKISNDGDSPQTKKSALQIISLINNIKQQL